MAVLKIPAMYARSGASAYTGTNTYNTLAIGYFSSAIVPYSQFTNGKTYRGCIGFDFSALEGATITSIKFYTQGVDTLGSGTGSWTMQLARTNQWSHTTLATATASASAQTGRWFARTITTNSFLTQISNLGGVGYIHVTASDNFKLWQGIADSSSTWPYLEVTYTKADAPSEPVQEDTIVITDWTAERCTYNASTSTYTPSSAGTYVRITLNAGLLTSGDYSNNALVGTPTLQYWKTNDINNKTTLTNIWTSGTSITKTMVLSGTFTVTNSWCFEISITDKYQTIKARCSVGAGAPILHLAGNQKGIAFGGYSTATTTESKFECYFPAYFYGGIAEGIPTDLRDFVTTGRTGSTNANANSYVDVNVSFGKTFTTTPTVLVSPEASSTAVNMGSVSLVLLPSSVTTTGFSVRIYNNTSNTRGLAFSWIAF